MKRLGLLLCLGFSLQAQEPLIDPEQYPPFPEIWDPYSLRFEYASNDSVFLTIIPPVISHSEKGKFLQIRDFSLNLPRKSIRVLLQDLSSLLSIQTGDGAQLQFQRADGSSGNGPQLTGLVKIERKAGEFRITQGGNRPFSSGPAVALRIIPKENYRSGLSVAGKNYRGNLELTPQGSGFLTLNSISIQDYLRGVVPKEMGQRNENYFEALKAQAIIARTYAIKRMLSRSSSDFDVYASVQDQVYGGIEVEYPLSDRAVTETSGLVLMYLDSLALCYYHSTCGGRTASRHEVWGGPTIPYLISQPDQDSLQRPWCRASSYIHWSQSWDLNKLTGIIRANLGSAGVRNAPSFHKLLGFRVQGRFACGRIQSLEVNTDGGAFVLQGDKIRFALKPGSGTGQVLESARFQIVVDHERVTAQGSGFGHGVGLCQMGALARSEAGQNYFEILNAYYPGTQLTRLQK